MFDSSGDELFGLSGDWILRSWAWRPMPDTIVTPTGSNTVRRLRFSRSGKLLASGAYDGKVIVWDAKSHERKVEINAHPSRRSRFGSLEFFDNERQLLTSGPDESKVKFWDISTGKMVDALTTTADTARFVLAADGTTLFVGVRGTIDKWDLVTKKRSSRVSPDGNDNAFIYNLAYSDSQDRLFSIYMPDNLSNSEYKYRRCEIWNGTRMEIEDFIKHDHEIGLRDIDVSPSGDLVGLCARDGAATVWDWKRGKLLHKLSVKHGAAHSNIVSAVRFSPRFVRRDRVARQSVDILESRDRGGNRPHQGRRKRSDFVRRVRVAEGMCIFARRQDISGHGCLRHLVGKHCLL